MPMIIAGLQPRTTYEAGRIRAGDKDENGRPHRLDGFRFTTHSENAALQVAELYDGYDLRPWGRQWEVYTKRRNLAVALPPGKLVISQAMMRWTGGGPTMVCNGERTSRPVVGPCQCPQPQDPSDEESVWRAIEERRRRAGQKVPAGCYPYTWINMALPDIDGFGVWTLLSKSERAASEIVQQARLLEAYRAADLFSPAEVALEYHESRVEGLLRQYNVPVLRVGKSLRAVAEELGGGELAAQLPPPPRERIAIAAAPGPVKAGVSPAPDPDVVDAVIVSDWLDMALAAAMTFTSEEEGRGLWREATEKAKAGEVTGTDAGNVKELITARLADLREAARGAVLDPEDPWSVKVEGLAADQDAADALAELDGLLEAGTVDPARAVRVRRAVLARFPGAAA